MAVILNLETATKNCSVSVAENGVCKSVVEADADKFIHSEKLHQFIQEALEKAKVKFADLHAIAVSNGPGSYTGLRIGISAAKGLCYALNIPMIALNTNDVLVARFAPNQLNQHFFSVIDARRNEVFGRFYTAEKVPITEIEAIELEKGMFAEYGENGLLIIGDAAQKTADILGLVNVEIHQELPSAKHMTTLAEEKFEAKDFANLAYHEPFYLKEFIAGRPKKLL